MPAIPEFLLRKLFVPGSMKPTETGFTFVLNNTFATVTLTRLSIRVDNSLVANDHVWVSLPGQSELLADRITPQEPFSMPVNTLVSVSVNAPIARRKLTITIETNEAGLLEFSILLGNEQGKKGRRPNIFNPFIQRLQNKIRIFRIQKDTQHPALHFTPPANWMNDPNGLIYWKGYYHLFFQHNPNEAAWGNIHWGHAMSKDLLRWKHLPVALSPDPTGADAGGCFSGCAVDRDGTPALIYTGVFPEVQCLAVSNSPTLLKWQKHSQPVIPAPPAGLRVEGFRDPCVWKEGQEWRMILGSGIPGAGGCVLLYRSADLIQWEYLGILFQSDHEARAPLFTGTMWECPSLFPLGDQWILILSAMDSSGGLYTIYYTGKFADNLFTPDGGPTLLDQGAGGCFYAPQTFLDEHGRRIMFGWMREARGADAQARAGWSGVLSFPRVLSIPENEKLLSSPLPEIASLRSNHQQLISPDLQSCKIKNTCLELSIKIPRDTRDWSGVILATNDDEDARVSIGYNPQENTFEVNCLHAGGYLSKVPLNGPATTDLQLQVFVDGSVIEVFQNGIQPISARFYLPQAKKLQVLTTGSTHVDLWTLKIRA